MVRLLAPRITFGDQTHSALVAPAARNRSTTCRHAWGYWPVLFPLATPQGYHLAFISCAKRISTTSRYSTTALATFLYCSSQRPSMVVWREKSGWLGPSPVRHGSSDSTGMPGAFWMVSAETPALIEANSSNSTGRQPTELPISSTVAWDWSGMYTPKSGRLASNPSTVARTGPGEAAAGPDAAPAGSRLRPVGLRRAGRHQDQPGRQGDRVADHEIRSMMMVISLGRTRPWLGKGRSAVALAGAFATSRTPLPRVSSGASRYSCSRPSAMVAQNGPSPYSGTRTASAAHSRVCTVTIHNRRIRSTRVG